MFESIIQFSKAKAEKRPITMVTCYDSTSAKIVAQSDVDCVLVGDSVAMTMHGYPDTTHATVDMIATHVGAVRRGLGSVRGFIVADFPFLEHRGSSDRAIAAAQILMRAGANAIKIEGLQGSQAVLSNLIEAGVPVMGHLGLTPQSIHAFGGFKVQAREAEAQNRLKQDAIELQSLGAFSLVLECIPTSVATEVTSTLAIPTIGIGAGSSTDGQVLVWQDLLGMNSAFRPRFVRPFANLESESERALNTFAAEVKARSFPTEKESYL